MKHFTNLVRHPTVAMKYSTNLVRHPTADVRQLIVVVRDPIVTVKNCFKLPDHRSDATMITGENIRLKISNR